MGLGAIQWVRGALYADLGLLFGAPLIALHLAGPYHVAVRRQALRGLAAAGIVLSLAGFVLTVAGMEGSGVLEIGPATVTFILGSTAVGWAFLIRLAALLLVLAALFATRVDCAAPLKPIAMLGAVAVASLAWSGHAAASEGANGLLRLVSGIVHLLAASAWLGALVVLLSQVRLTRPHDGASIKLAGSMLAKFSLAGSVIVATLIATGAVNGAFILAPAELKLLPWSEYGRILLAKLALFAIMLALATLNRFRLTLALTSESACWRRRKAATGPAPQHRL